MTQQVADPYAVLGVPRSASDAQIRQAYRRLAMRFHPDLHPDERSSERMRHVNEAWDVLEDPNRRRRYDADTRQPMSWAGATAQRANPHVATPPAEPTSHDSEGPGLAGALGIVAVAWLVMGTIFLGFLPAPILGLAALVAARLVLGGILRR
jgi:curved DNA-binding protein CbpA